MAVTLLMKWKMLQAVIQHTAARPSDGVVTARLLHHLNTTSLRCNPSYATIADATGLSRDTVMSSVRNLEQAGFLKVRRLVEPGEHAAKGQRLPSNSFEFDWSKITSKSEKSTTPSRKSRPPEHPPQSKIPTTLVENPNHPWSEKPTGGSRKSRPKQGKEETGNPEAGNRTHPAVAGQLALLSEIPCNSQDEKSKAGNGKRRSRKSKTELPAEWVLSTDQWNFGAKLGLTGPQIEEAQRKLKRWVKREGKQCSDWNFFIEEWLEREIAFLRRSGRNGGDSSDRAGFDEFLNGGTYNG